MNKYIVKNQNNKQNKNVFGMTDYDIPMFGFKSALKKLCGKTTPLGVGWITHNINSVNNGNYVLSIL